MLFSNATLLSFQESLPENFNELLAEQAFEPCNAFSQHSFGWVTPMPEGFSELSRSFGNRTLFCGRREEKVIPSSALQSLIHEKATHWESLEGERPSGKQRLRFKEAALTELLPRALCKSKNILAYVDPTAELMVINSRSANEVESFLNYLRTSLGSLTVKRLDAGTLSTQFFTQWLRRNQPPEGFALGDACDLFDPEDSASINCRRVSLRSPEILAHLDHGRICTRLRLSFEDNLSFTLDKDLVLQQIKSETHTDLVEIDDQVEPEVRALAELDAQFSLFSQEMARLYPKLVKAIS
ncbi:MAG: recombination-associated protein RdgC [Pseudomonadales bacterium]